MAYLKKNPEAQKDLQVTVNSQDQWEELLQKDGLIVVDAYAAWCGPCKAIVSTLKRIKNELGDDLLHFATAETDQIDSLSLYRGKSQPTFLFYCNGVLVYVIRGCNCPVMIKAISTQLEREHTVLEGKAERSEYIDEVVGAKPEEDEKLTDEGDEEIAAKMTKSMLCMNNKVSFRDMEGYVQTEVRKEVSLAIIKPDAVKAGLVDDIIQKVKSEGMEILQQEERTLTREEAAEFYKQHEGSEHFEALVEFMSSGPCMTLIISKEGAGEGIIPEFRDLIGPKDVNVAKEEAPNSIRAVYGTSSVMNAIHACDTSESAARELAFFFPDFVSPTVKTKKVAKESSHRTLALIRPDALRLHKDEILEKIKESGFSIAMAKEVTLTQEEAEDFYAEHRGKDFFEPLVQNMCSGPVMALCLAREDAVEGWRNLLGPKEIDVAKSEAPESLRAQFHVEESDMNPLHGSDSHSAARREIEKIFPVETTVAVIKPETAEESGEQIVDRIKEAGFRIISRKDVGLTKELAGQFYHEHEGKDFFNGLTDYMSSGQSTVLLLEREDAVTGWRAMMGPTDPDEAREKAPDSIRAVFGKDICRNAVHGASNLDKAGEVIEELFPEVELLPNGKVIVSPQILKSEGNALSEKQEGDQNNLQVGETQETEEGAADGGVREEEDDGERGGETTQSGEQRIDGNDADENLTEGDGTQGEADGTPGGDGTTGDDAPANAESAAKENEDGTTDVIVDSVVADGAAETTPELGGSGETANQDDGTKPDDGATVETTNDTPATPNANESANTPTNDNATAESKDAEEATTDGATPTQKEGSGDAQNTNDATTDEQPLPSSASKPDQDDSSKPNQDDPPATTKDDAESVKQT